MVFPHGSLAKELLKGAHQDTDIMIWSGKICRRDDQLLFDIILSAHGLDAHSNLGSCDLVRVIKPETGEELCSNSSTLCNSKNFGSSKSCVLSISKVLITYSILQVRV
jgi:hypothetical protein